MHFQPADPAVKFRALAPSFTPPPVSARETRRCSRPVARGPSFAGSEETSAAARRQITHALAYHFARWSCVFWRMGARGGRVAFSQCRSRRGRAETGRRAGGSGLGGAPVRIRRTHLRPRSRKTDFDL